MILLSIIIPAHNEERRILPCLKSITAYLGKLNRISEILVVANGCQDETEELIRIYNLVMAHNVRLISLAERGKGLAVRTGMLQATGKYRYMCDVDLSTPISELGKFFNTMDGQDIVIGSREIQRDQVRTTLRRRMIGRVFNKISSLLVHNIADTQCGFKLFTAEAARDLFSRSQINGMAFDVEILHLAQLAGYRIAQVPVRWTHDPDSRVRMVGDSWQMLLDLLRIYVNSVRGYQVRELPDAQVSR